VSVETNDASLVGTTQVIDLEISFVDYPLRVVTETGWLTVEFKCLPDSIELVTDLLSVGNPYTYTIEDDAVYFPMPTYKVQPEACAGQDMTYSLVATGSAPPPILDIVSDPNGLLNADGSPLKVIRLYTNNMKLARNKYDFRVKATAVVLGSITNEEVPLTILPVADCVTGMQITAPGGSEEVLIQYPLLSAAITHEYGRLVQDTRSQEMGVQQICGPLLYRYYLVSDDGELHDLPEDDFVWISGGPLDKGSPIEIVVETENEAYLGDHILMVEAMLEETPSIFASFEIMTIKVRDSDAMALYNITVPQNQTVSEIVTSNGTSN